MIDDDGLEGFRVSAAHRRAIIEAAAIVAPMLADANPIRRALALRRMASMARSVTLAQMAWEDAEAARYENTDGPRGA